MNRLYPIFLKVERRPVVVIGGGKVAEQKIKGILEARADITVIAPEVSSWIEELSEDKKIVLHRREYEDGDLEGYSLVIGATDDREVQDRIFNEAQARGIPANIVDVPELCTFYLSSVFQRGDLKIAVSTNGKSPTLGKIIRDKIEGKFSSGYPDLLERLGELRPEVQNAFSDFESRKKVREQIVRSELDRMEHEKGIKKDETGEVTRNLKDPGKVYLVGAGPGDPELITVKGLRVLQQADVVLYDALINADLLAEVPESAEKIFVGKRAGEHCMKQEKINELLICKALAGRRVVRLKGGDPFIFGRGGEELEHLRDAGIEVEIVPGITSGIGIPTSLGIPLTHRKEASSVVFVTGHSAGAGSASSREDPGTDQKDIDWKNLMHADTIVVYMGVKKLGLIVDQLIRNGLPSSRPIAVVFGGTTTGEKVIVGRLKNIEEKIEDMQESLPGLIVVGDVVNFFRNREKNGENWSPGSSLLKTVGAEIF
ncbi:MAG TPA: siroheme synthase CysG [Candidatus Acidoferrales bacterium]|nr:siroheme synthase CysG [Candidatus Acidoferrales bacterium]